MQNPISNSFYNSSNLATSLSYFMPFPFYHPDIFNQQSIYMANNYSRSLQTDLIVSVPSIDEFFGNLEKEFGENGFEEVKNKFIQETIDVSDILDLKEADWQGLEIKIGLKIKIIREAEKYRK